MGKDGAEQVRQFFSNLPYAQTLRLDLQELGAGWAVMVLPYHEDLIGDPATGVVHAGAVSALLDTTCGAAVASHPDTGAVTATLDLRIDYMRAAVPGQTLRARAEVIRVTRSIAFVRAETHDDGDDPIATATGAFTVT
ncbi:MAG: PaaI family thioesterase [Rhodobacteraceae bacterium]|nr:PaaI family thioesterase [Paracoccaceae bacterium]